MENNTVLHAADNPDLANALAAKAMQAPNEEVAAVEAPAFTAAPSGAVTLLAGIYRPFEGELIMDAEVRELTGADEEAVSKISDMGKGLMTILQRGTVTIGEEHATVALLDKLLAGDREWLLLAIRKMTFGSDVNISTACHVCGNISEFNIDLDTDVKVKKLEDPTEDRAFSVECKVGTVRVLLPNGAVQKKLITSTDKTGAELDTVLLQECIESINGMPIMNPKQILNLGLADRRKLLKEISERNIGPELSNIQKACPSCDEEVTISLSLAELFLI